MDDVTAHAHSSADALAARRWTLVGQVQGVGFRPFVYRLALAHGLTGWVRNCLGEVEIHAQGRGSELERFASALISDAPALARPRIERSHTVEIADLSGFVIRDSASSDTPRIHVPADYFACADCLREVDDTHDRRHAYPFTNCTQCGPRYTLIERLPYDRANTSLKDFPLCADCQREYDDPLDRRFHAEPTACPVCGPQLSFNRGEHSIGGNKAALAAALDALQTGMIVAVKGVGGYHLVCDARNSAAVSRLRQRKPRPHKPLAVMFPHLAAVLQCVALSDAERELLCSPVRPIVLARKHDATTANAELCAEIAPGLNEIGVLLPYAPLHHLLCRGFNAPLVMTSGNLSGEPVLTDPDEAQTRLARIADAFLQHNRPIVRPADDPVYRSVAGKPRPLRLGRGCAPLELTLPQPLATPTLAVGGHLKLTLCLAWEDRAVVSPHIGDMGTPRSLAVFEQVLADLQQLYGVQAQQLLCDAHPGYTTSRWAQTQAQRHALPLTRIWHHHAHASALAAEVAPDQEWLMFTWDGTGYGTDGTLWGGETFVGRPGQWQRRARLRPFRLPGGERAGREPWRSAAALCWESGTPFSYADADLALLHSAWQAGINSPGSSAAGRVFDAAASLTGSLQVGSFEGQGPMYLEACAGTCVGNARELPLTFTDAQLWQSDWAPLLHELHDQRLSIAQRAADFHASLARAILRQAERLRQEHGATRVGLTGGVFQNARLAELACAELTAAGFSVHLPEQLPCNDAGISFGQVIEALYAPRNHTQ